LVASGQHQEFPGAKCPAKPRLCSNGRIARKVPSLRVVVISGAILLVVII
jgi:hypothetical protein